MAEPKVGITVRLTRRQIKLLEDEAKRTEISVSDVLRRLIDDAADRARPPPTGLATKLYPQR